MPLPASPAALTLRDSARTQAALTTLWRQVDPLGDIHQHFALARQFLERGIGHDETQAFIRKVNDTNIVPTEDHQTLGLMVKNGFDPEQIALFVNASPEERRELEASWLKGFDTKETIRQGMERLSSANNIWIIPSAIGVFGSMALGFAQSNKDLIQTGVEVAQAICQPLADLASGVAGVPAATTVVGVVGTATLLLKNLPDLVKDVILDERVDDRLKAAQRSLSGSVHEVFDQLNGQDFPLLFDRVSLQRAKNELDAIPLPYTALLSHLPPKELVTFLASNDDARKTILVKNKPSLSQRLDAIQGLNPGRRTQFQARIRQSISFWNGVGDAAAVTPDNSLLALRAERDARRNQGLLPPEPARHPLPSGLQGPRP